MGTDNELERVICELDNGKIIAALVSSCSRRSTTIRCGCPNAMGWEIIDLVDCQR
jgi:hypothetical protein